jgi:DNA-binding NarL/FixJ family response regulator
MVLQITPSERDALRLMADGKANREIARDLGISEGAAEPHLTALFERMGASSRTEAIAAAVRRGLLHPPPAQHASIA